MSIHSQIDKEEEYLEQQYANGEITLQQLQKELNMLRRELEAYAEEQAEEVYRNIMGY